MIVLRYLFAPIGMWIEWRYRRYADRLNGGDES